MKKFNKRGFTIVELVIVIAVIGILAGVLIPTFSSITQKAKQTAAKQEATSGRDALLALTNGSMPDNTFFFVGDYDEDTDALTTNFVFKYSAGAMEALDESESRTIQPYDDDEDDGYYVMYVSDEMITSETLDEGYRANVLKIAGFDPDAYNVTPSTESGDYILLTVVNKTDSTDKGLIRVYWTSDINPTMIIALGNVR